MCTDWWGGACLRGVDVPLNDVEDGDVAPLLRARGHHDVFRLRQPPHHVQHRRASHGARLKEARATTIGDNNRPS